MPLRFLAVLLAAFSGPASAAADNSTTTPTPPPVAPGVVLRIGVHEAPPFAMRAQDGSWHGLGVVLWEMIAKKNGWKFEYVPAHYEELIPMLSQGNLDLVVGEMLVNPADEELIDFSQPFLNTSIGVAVSRERWNPSWLQILLFAFDWSFMKLFLGVLPILILVSFLIWRVEKKHNARQFGGSPAHGLGAAFWFTAVTMTATGYGDKAPVTFRGRVLTIIWMFISLILVTGFTASVASTVATVRTGTSVGNTADLMRFKNAVLHGSISQQILTSFSAPIEIFEELDDALNAVINGTADTVVADSLILSYLVNHKFKERLMLLDMDLAQARVAMAMPVNSPLREPLNVALLAAIRTPEWREATTDYLANEHHNFP